jgi:hypothetical protein
MANMQFNPTSTMNNMMMSNHIMGHFNNIMYSNNTLYETVTDTKFISQTMIMFIQIIAISIFSGFTNHFTGFLNSFKYLLQKFIKNILFGYILFPIFWLYRIIYKKIFKQIPKFKITRNISLITSEFKRNGQLLEIIQWYISSDFCKKGKKKNVIANTTMEIYYPQSAEKPLYDYNFKSSDKIDFSVGHMLNDDFIILYENHEIVCYRQKTEIQLNGDIEAQKRDNITYYLETYDENESSNIIEKFCDNAVRTYNSNRVEWTQKIFHNEGCEWKEPKDIFSPSSVDSVILRDDVKEEFVQSLDFFFNNKDFYKNHGQRYKYVTVMMGPPGTGKTTLAMAYSNQNKRHIYALDMNESSQGDLKNLIERMNTSNGDLLIDDFDHYFSTLGQEDQSDKKKKKDDSDDENQSMYSTESSKSTKSSKSGKTMKQKSKISYHELLTVLDGTGSKEGLNIYICINDPSKLFKTTNIEDLALFRDRRVNKILEFKYCNHKMISGIYKSIFNREADSKLIKMIPEDYYAPCVIAQQFISFFEKYGGHIENKFDEIDNILINLAKKDIETNQDKIVSYIKTLKEYNEKK